MIDIEAVQAEAQLAEALHSRKLQREAWEFELRNSSAKDARIAELAALLAYGTDTDAYRRIRARAEQAEAERDRERLMRKLYEDAAGDWQPRAERAEAEADSLRNTIDNMRAMNIKITFESTGKVLAAQAERNAARDLVSKQAEDEGLWFVPVSITEDYLQCALRALHEAVEGKSSEECARAALNPPPAGREG